MCHFVLLIARVGGVDPGQGRVGSPRARAGRRGVHESDQRVRTRQNASDLAIGGVCVVNES
ncbi:hypothetical protein AKJ09_03622 [Labilithrix luteola]|uniref:Uncharacterized protein n=1 Tax=Labilithrix luteola TaxID=1391654 RepID=A0A0K1PTT8_9BACT|nr:hypothetical protein AKJ09_03622 [Labilithrix luteola]